MAAVVDSVTGSINQKMLDIFRILFQIYRDTISNFNRTIDLNHSLDTYYDFMTKLEKYYDLENSTYKMPNPKNPYEQPFDISICKTFATKEVQRELEKTGVKSMVIEVAGKGHFLITPADEKSRAIVNNVKFETLKKYSFSPMITSKQLYNDCAGRDVVRFEGFSQAQIDEFTKYAQEKGFYFAAPYNENGTRTIEISKIVAEQATFNISEKINEISAYTSQGLSATLDALYAKKNAMILDSAINDLRTSGSSAPREKTYFIDAQDPSHYVVINGAQMSVANETLTQTIMGDQMEQAFYNELRRMHTPTQFTETQFKAMYGGDVLSADARIKFAQENFNLTKFQMNAHLFGVLEQRATAKGIDFDITKILIEKMKIGLEKSQNAQDKKLLEQITKMPPTIEQVKEMLETGDSVKSGCITDFALGKSFNETFKGALASVVAEQVRNEKMIIDFLKESKTINIYDLNEEARKQVIAELGITDTLTLAMTEHFMDDIQISATTPNKMEIIRADNISTEEIENLIEAAEDVERVDSTTHFNSDPFFNNDQTH